MNKNAAHTNIEMSELKPDTEIHPNEVYQNFEMFWPRYLKEHQSPLNRRLHFVGTNLAAVFLIFAVVLVQPWFIAAALVSGYGFAWIGHFFIEKNRPLTFKYPVMSLKADLKAFQMTWKRILKKK